MKGILHTVRYAIEISKLNNNVQIYKMGFKEVVNCLIKRFLNGLE